MSKKESIIELNNILKEICGISIFDNCQSRNRVIKIYASYLLKIKSFETYFVDFLNERNLINKDWINRSLSIEIDIIEETVKIFEPEDWHKNYDEEVWLKGKYFHEIFPALKEYLENLINKKYTEFKNDFEVMNNRIIKLADGKIKISGDKFVKENDNELLAL